MDGKKRIARLRNAERWKKLGVVPIAKVIKVINPNKPKMLPLDYFVPKHAPPEKVMFHKMVAFLQKRGWSLLGQGAYSMVWGHPKQEHKVIKVSRSNDNWIDYIEWGAKKGYVGGFVPRVYSWKLYPDGTSVAVVERMDKTLSHMDRMHDYKIVENLLWRSDHPKAREFLDSLIPGSAKFFSELFLELHASDVYGKNMMIRKDGSFCVTDPVCGRRVTTKTRFRSGELSPSVKSYWNCIESSNRHRSQWASQSYQDMVHCM